MRISDWSSDVCSSDLLHGPSPSKERDRAARMPPGRVGSGRFAEFGRFLGSARCVAAYVAARARAGELAAVDDQIFVANRAALAIAFQDLARSGPNTRLGLPASARDGRVHALLGTVPP